jgi:hypothetical protein
VTNVQTQLTTAQTNLMQADIPTISTQLSWPRRSRRRSSRDRATEFDFEQPVQQALIACGWDAAGLFSRLRATFCTSLFTMKAEEFILNRRGSMLAPLRFIWECNARPPAGSVAQRVSALARRDLLRQEGGDADEPGCAGFSSGPQGWELLAFSCGSTAWTAKCTSGRDEIRDQGSGIRGQARICDLSVKGICHLYLSCLDGLDLRVEY